MTFFQKFFQNLDKLLTWSVAVFCLVLLSALFIQVINRYLLSVSFPALQFIISLCFLWMCMLGTALAVRRNQHFEVDLLASFLGPKSRQIQSICMSLMVFFGGVMMTWTAIDFVELGLIKKHPSTGIKMVYIYASLQVGGVLICLLAVEKLFIQLFGAETKATGEGI